MGNFQTLTGQTRALNKLEVLSFELVIVQLFLFPSVEYDHLYKNSTAPSHLLLSIQSIIDQVPNFIWLHKHEMVSGSWKC